MDKIKFKDFMYNNFGLRKNDPRLYRMWIWVCRIWKKAGYRNKEEFVKNLKLKTFKSKNTAYKYKADTPYTFVFGHVREEVFVFYVEKQKKVVDESGLEKKMVEGRYTHYPIHEIMRLVLKKDVKGVFELKFFNSISFPDYEKEYFVKRLVRHFGKLWFKDGMVGFPYKEEHLYIINRKEFEIKRIEEREDEIWVWLSLRDFV
jgi:hypothetical protein